jgi:hypothetical protein
VLEANLEIADEIARVLDAARKASALSIGIPARRGTGTRPRKTRSLRSTPGSARRDAAEVRDDRTLHAAKIAATSPGARRPPRRFGLRASGRRCARRALRTQIRALIRADAASKKRIPPSLGEGVRADVAR